MVIVRRRVRNLLGRGEHVSDEFIVKIIGHVSHEEPGSNFIS